MAQKSCDVDKDEAEILQPSSPSPSPSQPTTTSDTTNPLPSSPPSLLKTTEEISVRRPERPETLGQVPCKLMTEKESQAPVKFTKRCSSCRKRVGLTGFHCRCGDLFCAQHRYSDTHDCSFDYKALGREEISKANPAIRAAKIIKI